MGQEGVVVLLNWGTTPSGQLESQAEGVVSSVFGNFETPWRAIVIEKRGRQTRPIKIVACEETKKYIFYP